MNLTNVIITSIFLISIISKVHASNDYYVGIDYIYDSIEVDQAGDIPRFDGWRRFSGDPEIVDMDPDSFKSGEFYIGYKFHPNFSLEIGYAQSKTEKIYFDEQRLDLSSAINKISSRSYRAELLGNYFFQGSQLSMIASIGAVLKEVDYEVTYKINLICVPVVGVTCPSLIQKEADIDRDIRIQYGVGVQYQFNENISTRLMVKSVLNGFSFSSGTPYSWNMGIQYHF